MRPRPPAPRHPVRARAIFTLVACLRPPLGVRISRRFSSAAIAFNPVIPSSRIASITGRTRGARLSVFAFSRATPFGARTLPEQRCSAVWTSGLDAACLGRGQSGADPLAYHLRLMRHLILNVLWRA